MKVKMGFFKCMESMVRHPYIPSTTVLGDRDYVIGVKREFRRVSQSAKS